LYGTNQFVYLRLLKALENMHLFASLRFQMLRNKSVCLSSFLKSFRKFFFVFFDPKTFSILFDPKNMDQAGLFRIDRYRKNRRIEASIPLCFDIDAIASCSSENLCIVLILQKFMMKISAINKHFVLEWTELAPSSKEPYNKGEYTVNYWQIIENKIFVFL